MMSNNFSPRKNIKTVWRNIAVAVFAVCFAVLGLCVTVIPTRAVDDEPFLITNPVFVGTAELGEYPQTYVGDELNKTLKILGDNAKTGKTYTSTVLGKEIAWDEYVYQNERYVKVDGSLVDQINRIPTFSDGTAIVTGAIYFFKVEPLVWDIFQQSEKMVAVLHNVIGRINFNALSGGDSSWQDSYLRSFLNQRLLTEAGIENYAAVRKYYSSTPESDTAGDLLTDQCWLPSYLEYPKFYPTDAARLKLSSDYSLASGDNLDSKKYSFVVLRTVSGQKTLCKVNSDGVMYSTVAQKNYIEGFPAAFVLNETAMETILPTVLPAITVTYNGNDQQIETMTDKPDWYNDGMQITYTKDGGTVTTVKDAGEYAVTVQWGEYTRTTTLTVNPKAVSVNETTIKAQDRTYNRERGVELEAITVNGIITGDTVTVNSNGIMDDKNAGEKTVNVTVSLTGTDAKNYVLTESQFTSTVNIARQTVTVEGIIVEDKEYDNTPRAVFNTRNVRFTGLIPGDDLTVAVHGEYGQSTVGDNLTVTLQSLVLDGNDANNYTIANGSQKEVTGCRIKPRIITVMINDQTVKAGDPQKPLTAHVTSGSLAGDDQADTVYQLSLIAPDGELPVGEYKIIGEAVGNANYHVTFTNDGKYRVLSAEEWDALQANDGEKGDNNLWLIIIIVIAVAAFIGALVGIGLVVRSHDKNRDPKPTKEKKVKTEKGAKQPDAVGNQK